MIHPKIKAYIESNPTKSSQKSFDTIWAYAEKQSELFYNTDGSGLTDEEYDYVADWLEKISGKRPFSAESDEGDFGLADHQHWFENLLGTLGKVNTLKQFIDEFHENGQTYYVSPKIDGNSIAITFNLETGKVIDATTRGKDGKGKNLLYLFSDTFFNPEQLIPIHNGKLAIKCEACVTWKHLGQYNEDHPEKTYKSPRSFITAILGKKESVNIKQYMSLQIIECEYDGSDQTKSFLESKDNRLITMKKLANVVQSPFNISVVNTVILTTVSELSQMYNKFSNDLRYKYPFQLDGIVIEKQKHHGEWNGNKPTYAIALKFPYVEKETTVTGLRVDQGAVNGTITPVIQFDPVVINGHEYSNVSLASYKRWKELMPLGIGSRLVFQLRNDTLGYVVKTADSDLYMTSQLHLPTNCLCCDEPLTESATGDTLFCGNEFCDANIVGKGAKFLQHLGVKGINENTIDKLYQAELYKNYASALVWANNPKTFIEKASSIPRLGEQSATKIVKALQATIRSGITDVKLFSAFNIYGLGEKAFTEMFRRIKVIELFQMVANDELQKLHTLKIAGWAKINTDKFISAMETNYKIYYTIYNALKNYVIATEALDEDFEVLNIAITGTLVNSRSISRKILTQQLKQLGHNVTGSVSKKTNFLIMDENDSSSSKAMKAKENGIPIIKSEQALVEFGI